MTSNKQLSVTYCLSNTSCRVSWFFSPPFSSKFNSSSLPPSVSLPRAALLYLSVFYFFIHQWTVASIRDWLKLLSFTFPFHQIAIHSFTCEEANWLSLFNQSFIRTTPHAPSDQVDELELKCLSGSNVCLLIEQMKGQIINTFDELNPSCRVTWAERRSKNNSHSAIWSLSVASFQQINPLYLTCSLVHWVRVKGGCNLEMGSK